MDQRISYYACVRRSNKWTNKLIMYLFQICIFNAFVLFKARHPLDKRVNMLSFHESIVEAWTMPQLPPRPPQIPRSKRHHHAPDPRGPPSIHRLARLPPTRQKRHPTRRCYMCYNHCARRPHFRSETAFQCIVCLVPLHRKFCFKRYHDVHAVEGQTCAR